MAIKEGPQAPLQPAPPEKRAREAQVRKQTFIRVVGSIGLATAAGLGLFAGYDAFLAPKGQDQKTGQTTPVPTFGDTPTPGDTPTITPESAAQLETSVQNWLNGKPPINYTDRFFSYSNNDPYNDKSDDSQYGENRLLCTTDANQSIIDHAEGASVQAYLIGFTEEPSASAPSQKQYLVELGFEDYQKNRIAVAFHTADFKDLNWFGISSNHNQSSIDFKFDHNAADAEQVAAELQADTGKVIMTMLALGADVHWPAYAQTNANNQVSTAKALAEFLLTLQTHTINEVTIPDALAPFISYGSHIVSTAEIDQRAPILMEIKKYAGPQANINAGPTLPTITTAVNTSRVVEFPAESAQPIVIETTTGRNPSVIIGPKPEVGQKPKKPEGVSYADWVIARAARAKQIEADMNTIPAQGNRRDRAA